MKNIILTGANGQLGFEVQRACPQGYNLICLGRTELDIANRAAVFDVFEQNKPIAVINAAAYTAVDKAETDIEQARKVNALGPRHLAEACQAYDSYLFHVSTDFVFDGSSNTPYLPSDKAAPIGAYGQTKYEGEQAILASLPDQAAIVRTAWVYSSHGGNFVKSMLRLMADRPELGIVVDQVGTPTWAKGLAQVAWQAVESKLIGVHHWSDLGVTSWYDFAVAIQEEALALGLLEREIVINPIPASAYPTPAKRPHYSVLDKASLLEALPSVKGKHWRANLREMLKELKAL